MKDSHFCSRFVSPCVAALLMVSNAFAHFGSAGLLQTWYKGRANSQEDVRRIFSDRENLIIGSVAGHGHDWWFGTQLASGQLSELLQQCQFRGIDCPDYPFSNGEIFEEHFPIEDDESFRDYTVALTGQLLIPESGTYRFADGNSGYTYLAIDLNGNNRAGDVGNEVLIDDGNRTDVDRDRGIPTVPASVEITVPEGGEWREVTLYVSDRDGLDAGIMYWNYDVRNNQFFDDSLISGRPLSQNIIPDLWIPRSHTRPNAPEPEPLPRPPALQAGDADQDLDFDQLDLVRVQIAAKYLSGEPASWGEGDWNGGASGSQGNPPDGDGVFDQLDIIFALGNALYLTGPYGAVIGKREVGGVRTSMIYDAATGELSIDAPAGCELTSISIDSLNNLFEGTKPASLTGVFDTLAADKLFKATLGGSFGSINFGKVLPTGLSQEVVVADLKAHGSLFGGGDLEIVDLVYIPEPATVMLLGAGFAGLLLLLRRRKQ